MGVCFNFYLLIYLIVYLLLLINFGGWRERVSEEEREN